MREELRVDRLTLRLRGQSELTESDARRLVHLIGEALADAPPLVAGADSYMARWQTELAAAPTLEALAEAVATSLVTDLDRLG